MTDTGDALGPGTRLGEFEIERVLGAGGFGVTYLARDLSLDAWRAVKEYLPRDWGTRQGSGTVGPRTSRDAADYQWGLERFLDEARVLEKFRNRHIVPVYRVFEARGTAYMVTEYIEGRTLAEELQAAGVLSESRVREVLDGLLDGLSEVHAAGLVHRDIKPGNVMVGEDGRGTPVLIDFGSARRAMGERSGSLLQVLTPPYAPIEQYGRRADQQGPWTDIYALGVLTYEALSGQSVPDAPERVSADGLRPLAEAAAGRVSVALASAVDAALAVHAVDRPRSLTEWRECWETRPAAGPPARPAAEPLPPPPPPRPAWLYVAAAAGVGVVALLVALSMPPSGSAPEGDAAGGSAEPGSPPGAGAADDPPPADPEPDPVAEPPRDPGPDPAPDPLPPDPEPAPPPDPEPDPPSAAEVEAGLGLDGGARRALQAALAAAGFDPGVPDGVFGPGTRAQIRLWQVAEGLDRTGYLDAGQLVALRETNSPAADPPPPDPSPPDPPSPAEVEAELGLDRAAWRLIQLGLASSGFAPGLVDGESSARTRSALREWQASRGARGEPATGYLDAASAAVLRAAGGDPRAGTVFRECARCPELVVVPAGTFLMGSDRRDDESSDDERPRHRVTVARFALGVHEVTRDEYGAFAAATGRTSGDGCGAVDAGTGAWGWREEASWRAPGYPADGGPSGGVRELGGRAGVCAVAERGDGRTLSAAERGGVGACGAWRDDDPPSLGRRRRRAVHVRPRGRPHGEAAVRWMAGGRLHGWRALDLGGGCVRGEPVRVAGHARQRVGVGGGLLARGLRRGARATVRRGRAAGTAVAVCCAAVPGATLR